MQGAGGMGLRAASEKEFEAAMRIALSASGPVLIDVLVEPDGYARQLRAMRG
jgi:thiamine pyrophosphate-dependent acetolactate synthase large subunit-like protein